MKLKRKTKIALIASAAALAVLLAGAGTLELARRSTAASLNDQRAAVRWGGTSSAQLSCFFAEGAGPSPGRMYSVERTVDSALTDASLEAPAENARLWYHAYSVETELYAVTTRASATLTVTAFGGDFFYIHQPDLRAGSYLQPGGGNAGYIFLDENAAWRLFGAINVVGMPLTLGGYEYTVCGVGAAPQGTVYDEAYGSAPRAYILFDSPAAESLEEASVYETVLPNPIKGFAFDTLEKSFPAGEGCITVENSARYGFSSLWKLLGEREKLGVRTSAVVYPWWENMARVAEYRCATMLLLELILLSLAALECLVWIGIAWKPAGEALGRAFHGAREGVEETYNRLTRPRPRGDRAEQKERKKQEKQKAREAKKAKKARKSREEREARGAKKARKSRKTGSAQNAGSAQSPQSAGGSENIERTGGAQDS